MAALWSDGSPVVPLVLLAIQLSVSPFDVSSGFCTVHNTDEHSPPSSSCSSMDWQLLAQLACKSARQFDIAHYAGDMDSAHSDLNTFLIDRSDLLAGNLGSLADEGIKHVISNCPVVEERSRDLRSRVATWHAAEA
jgi:hypothetical protein